MSGIIKFDSLLDIPITTNGIVQSSGQCVITQGNIIESLTITQCTTIQCNTIQCNTVNCTTINCTTINCTTIDCKNCERCSDSGRCVDCRD